MILRWFKHFMRRQARKDLALFQERFGEQVCPVCSFHRFGFMHGYEASPTPSAHEGCPEKRCVLETTQNPPTADTGNGGV